MLKRVTRRRCGPLSGSRQRCLERRLHDPGRYGGFCFSSVKCDPDRTRCLLAPRVLRRRSRLTGLEPSEGQDLAFQGKLSSEEEREEELVLLQATGRRRLMNTEEATAAQRHAEGIDLFLEGVPEHRWRQAGILNIPIVIYPGGREAAIQPPAPVITSTFSEAETEHERKPAFVFSF